MVKVREDRHFNVERKIDSNEWCKKVLAQCYPSGSKEQSDYQDLLIQACEYAKSLEDVRGLDDSGWGEGYTTYSAGLEMAEILAELQMDGDTLIAAVLYRSYREGKIAIDVVSEKFGEVITHLLEGVKKMAAISGVSSHNEGVFGLESDEQAENVRKMLVALVDDVRIALIKLAERTCAIRAVKKASVKQRQKVAREVSNIYAPLAHRLGIGHIKWELEDLAFRYLQPYDYKYIAKLLSERRLDRQNYIDEVIEQIQQSLSAENIKAQVYGRAKHIYSIWRKMHRKNISFSEVYDIRAVRILVQSERECYAVLGIVHSLWRNIPHEFDDYIANPKENGYQSLHTAVHGPSNRVLEIQIRTENMHEDAEFGVCAHWRYKSTDKDESQAGYERKIEWLRQVIEWHDELGGVPWEDQLPAGIHQDRIYIFTPEGHVIELPEGATPIDFAFKIHTDVGIRCRGAKVNGRIVPLNHQLKTSDQVEVLTSNHATPSRDWLNKSLAYIVTSKARSCLQQWFKHQDRDQNIADGRAMLDHEFKRLAFHHLDFESLAQKLQQKNLDDLYASVGMADISVEKVIHAAQKLLGDEKSAKFVPSMVGRAAQEGDLADDVYIDGVGNLLSSIAQCCKPIPGDSIAGYITKNRGVSIHRKDCSNLLNSQSHEPERIIAVDWADAPGQLYSVDIALEAFDRHGLLRDITTLLDHEKVNVSAMRTLSNKDKNTVDMGITIEIADFRDLSRVLARLNQLPNVSSVRRSH